MRNLILAGSDTKVSIIAALMQLLDDNEVLIVEQPIEHIEPEVYPFHNLCDMIDTIRDYIIFPIISHISHYINRFTKHRTLDKRALIRMRLHKYI